MREQEPGNALRILEQFREFKALQTTPTKSPTIPAAQIQHFLGDISQKSRVLRRRYLLLSKPQCPRVMRDVVADKACDEVVAVIVARLHAQREWMLGVFAGRIQ
jgi:hypothetical protein